MIGLSINTVENGRKILNDEMDEDSPLHHSKKKKQEEKKKKIIVYPGAKPNLDIKSKFAPAADKVKVKPKRDVRLTNDDMLEDLLYQMYSTKNSTSSTLLKPVGIQKKMYNLKRELLKNHSSCCISLKTIEKSNECKFEESQETAEDVTMAMVYEESNALAEKYKIDKIIFMKLKKNYAFETLDIPVEVKYLELRYAGELPALPSDLKG
ncbi:DNA polymerase alpha catalytic subunit [Bulinus truncatus]|nr:DNA polymerase alpha catalytic subunit [Bulinus truncatus]